MAKRGRPPGAAKPNRQFNFRMPPTLTAWIQESCAKSGRRFSDEVRNRLLWSFALGVNSAIDAPIEGAIWVKAWEDQAKA